jgi:hypothetical protein
VLDPPDFLIGVHVGFYPAQEVGRLLALAVHQSQRAVSGRRTMTDEMAERESMRRQLSVGARAAPTK